jgi:GT2 family glycosyltransferase
MSKVYVHLLVWNDRRYLPDLFDSLQTQSFKDFTVRVLDNGSMDDTLKFIQEKHPRTLVARNNKNAGFAPAHNQLMKFTVEHLEEGEEDPFVLVLNSDMILHPDLIGTLVKALEANPKLAAVQPKLFRAFGEVTGDDALVDVTLSDILDTTGMGVKKGWRMFDRGAGELDEGQYDAQTDIFGATGTCALFRLSALLDVLVDDEVFDGDFFAYKEDCDLAWRLRKAGWDSLFVPAATAHHYRGMFGADKQTFWQRIRNRRSQRPFFAALSTRNQVFMLMKNLSVLGFIKSSPRIVLGNGGRMLYGFLFETETRRRLLSSLPLFFKMLKKRKQIKTDPEVSEESISSYIV